MANLSQSVCSLCIGSVVLTGCSTMYPPKPSRHVAVIMNAGTPGYVRDGRFYSGGAFGGDLEEAVRGNPEAEAHAKSFRSGMIAGFVSVMAGTVSGVGGGTLFLANSGSDNHDSGAQAGGAVLFFGGLVAYTVGFVLLANAQPHLWDAINTYNDGVSDIGRPPPYGPYAPPIYPPNGPPSYGPSAPPLSPGPKGPPSSSLLNGPPSSSQEGTNGAAPSSGAVPPAELLPPSLLPPVEAEPPAVQPAN